MFGTGFIVDIEEERMSGDTEDAVEKVNIHEISEEHSSSSENEDSDESCK